ncbi:NADH-quinone oxidoreductase subunit J [Thermogutta sp.]|uniref:NADH-quinone oxidoreductase subunit J family protein n=1 Tax=Thermogutta sp. TaxID=1962930 RepID=UPI003C7B784E
MVSGTTILLAGMLLTLAGLFWALPWGTDRRRAPGWILVASGLVMMASLIPSFGGFLARSVLWGMTLVTLGSAVAMITSLRPLYSALWFGMTVLGTAGLILYHGAEFVSMALIVVYIGAILVVFLFLIMLDEPRGQAGFNRRSWEPFIASLAGVVLIGLVSGSALEALRPQDAQNEATQTALLSAEKAASSLVPTKTLELGEELFGAFPLAVEGLGLLLMLGLIGATAIITRPLEPLLDLRSWETPGMPVLVEWLP